MLAPGNPGRRFERSRHNEVEVLRVKLGVGRAPQGNATGDWVLGDPTAEDTATLGSACDVAALAVEIVLDEGPVRAMNRINGGSAWRIAAMKRSS
jgi:peptidyl-tRNA hydrolase